MRVTGESSGGEAARLSGGLARLNGRFEPAGSELQRLNSLRKKWSGRHPEGSEACLPQAGFCFWRKGQEKADPSGKRRLRDDNLSVFPQTVKLLALGKNYVVAKATTHKDSRVPTRTLIPRSFGSPLEIQILRTAGTLALPEATANQPQRMPGSVNLGGPLKPNESGG